MLKGAYPGHLCRVCDGRGMHLDPKAGPWFRAMRLRAGISQTAMAAALGKRPQRVCDWEAGRQTIPPRIAEKWELLCQERTQASAPTRPPREPCERDEVTPHTPPQSIAVDHEVSAPSETAPEVWIPRGLREQGWKVINGRIVGPGSARLK